MAFEVQTEKVTRLLYRVGRADRGTERFIELDFELVQHPEDSETVYIRPRNAFGFQELGTNEEASTLDQGEKPRIVKFEFVNGRPFGDAFHIYDYGTAL